MQFNENNLYFYKKITTGAADDLQKVYELATTIVKRLGMSEKIGYLSFKDDEIIKIYSEQTQKVDLTKLTNP